MPQLGIHGVLVRSWKVPSRGASSHQRPIESTNSRIVTARVVRLAALSVPSRTGTTPMSGSSTSACRIQWPYPMASRKSVMSGSPDHGAEDPERPDEKENDVDTDLAGLQAAAEPAQSLGQLGGTVDRCP